MKNANEMTLAECLQELSEVHHRPTAPTLDAIAGAMPEGFCWLRHRNPLRPVGWKAKAYCPCWKAFRRTTNTTVAIIEDTGDEKLDRARLAVACWRASNGK